MRRLANRLRRPVAPALAAAMLAGVCVLGAVDCSLQRPDRRAYQAFARGDYAQAAAGFVDAQWRAAALYRQGEFAQAAAILAGFDTAEAAYNQANALVMLGRYEEALRRYERALALRPGWAAAVDNLAIARSRAQALARRGGDMTGGRLAADEVVFSPDSAAAAERDDDREPATGAAGDAALRALWLRQVQTRPADFLRAKFAYQYAMRQDGGG